MSQINPQKDYIQHITNTAMNPLLCSNAYFKQETQQYVPGKRYNLSKHVLKDYLTVASNQVIFELDAKAYATNYEIANKIIDVLKEYKCPYYIFSSGGKGIHIEVWFNPIEFTQKANKTLYEEVLSYNFSYKHVRLWFWNKVLDEAGISSELRGAGKLVDSSCIVFDDIAGKSKLIRVAGGRKIYYQKLTTETQTFYKTYIPNADFTKRQTRLTTFDNVRYPEHLNRHTIDEFELAEYLSQFVEMAKNSNIASLKNVDLGKNGYLELESIKRIREGLGSGQRALGAQILSIAMACDEVPKVDQEIILKDYVGNCEQTGSQFVFEEAKGWLDWVQKQEKVFWNCSLTIQAGLHDPYLCEFCKKRHAKEIKFLSESNILKKINKVLDAEIIGESDNKMLMFLLMLSKDFPSKTGNPGWGVQGDPMSQNIILSSDSSSGKSWMTKKIIELFGEKDLDYFIVSRYTKSAMNYYTEINMDGKIIFIEELQGLDENTAQLRVWMSEGELSLSTVEKVVGENGSENNALVQKSTVGQPVFITNQAEGKVEDQLNNRSWVLGLDTSDTQTARILDFQDAVNCTKRKTNSVQTRLIRDALKQLKPYHFIIPFANWKILNIPSHDVRARRDYQKFLTLIKCSAYLHQRQRGVLIDEDDNEYLLCTKDDYNVALQYSSGILGATFSGLTTQQIDLINYLKKSSFGAEFTITELMRGLGKSQPYWYGQLQQLEDLGYVSGQKSPGKTTIYSLNSEKVINTIKLPNADKLEDPNLLQLLQVFSKTKMSIDDLKKSAYSCNSISPSTALEKQSDLLCKKEVTNGVTSIESNELLNRERIHNRSPSRTQVFDFIKNSSNHIVKKLEIIENFGVPTERSIEILLTWLKQSGDISEVKPEQYISNF